MKKWMFLGMICLVTYSLTSAQKACLTLRVDKDSLRMGESVMVEYNIDNIDGEFIQPDFIGLQLVYGPNTSSSFSMINGKVTQSKTYSYMLRPTREGSVSIGPASLKTEDGNLLSEEVEIYVLDRNHIGSFGNQKRSFIYDLYSESDPSQADKKNKKRIMKKI